MKTQNQQNAEALRRRAEDFRNAVSGHDGAMQPDDLLAYDAMIKGAETLEAGGLQTQSQLDRNPRSIAGVGGKGERLVDERGRIHRALGRDESFAEAVLENGERFGITADQEKLVDDGLSVGGLMRAIAVGPQTAGERWAMSTGNATSAGYTVPSILSAMIIDRFRARTVLMKAGAQTLPLDGAEHSFAKLTGDATPTWRREGTDIGEGQQTFGRLTFYPCSLAVIVKFTRELMQDSPNITQAIERSLTAAFSLELDRAGLLGSGNEEPTGLRNQEGLNEMTAIGAVADYTDFVDAVKLMMDDNTPDPTAAIISNREWSTLAKLVAQDDQPLVPPPAIAGLPFLPTSAIPTNLGGGTESLAFTGHFPDVIFGMRSELQIELLRELYAETGHFAYAAQLRVDVGVFHPESIVRMLGITP